VRESIRALVRGEPLAIDIIRSPTRTLSSQLGGDWDGDGKSKDERFLDPVHFELCWRSVYLLALVGWHFHIAGREAHVRSTQAAPRQ
jgi:hypothetical protein